MSGLDKLPIEILKKIVEYIDYRDLLNFAILNKYFCQICLPFIYKKINIHELLKYIKYSSKFFKQIQIIDLEKVECEELALLGKFMDLYLNEIRDIKCVIPIHVLIDKKAPIHPNLKVIKLNVNFSKSENLPSNEAFIKLQDSDKLMNVKVLETNSSDYALKKIIPLIKGTVKYINFETYSSFNGFFLAECRLLSRLQLNNLVDFFELQTLLSAKFCNISELILNIQISNALYKSLHINSCNFPKLTYLQFYSYEAIQLVFSGQFSLLNKLILCYNIDQSPKIDTNCFSSVTSVEIYDQTVRNLNIFDYFHLSSLRRLKLNGMYFRINIDLVRNLNIKQKPINISQKFHSIELEKCQLTQNLFELISQYASNTQFLLLTKSNLLGFQKPIFQPQLLNCKAFYCKMLSGVTELSGNWLSKLMPNLEKGWCDNFLLSEMFSLKSIKLDTS